MGRFHINEHPFSNYHKALTKRAQTNADKPDLSQINLSVYCCQEFMWWRFSYLGSLAAMHLCTDWFSRAKEGETWGHRGLEATSTTRMS